MLRICAGLLVCAVIVPGLHAGETKKLFDGKTLAGWEGDAKTWRVEDGAIVGGSLETTVPRNEFLCTSASFGDFELKVKFKLIGDKAGANGGVQFRTKRIPKHHEVSGYQADIGQGYWGALYDESRRNKVLAGPDAKLIDKIVKHGEWNDYKIRAEGPRIRLWLNGKLTVDYTEKDDKIERAGIIGLQIHGGAKAKAMYKDILLEPLAPKKKPAQASDEFFRSDKVIELKIDIGAKELDALRRNPRAYVKATLKEGESVYKNVGIHVKGAAGSFRGIDDKPGLTLNMDKYDEEQTFHGMDKFHLANSVQDPSYLSELICGEMFRAAGVPASRVSHAVVTINGRRRGMYYLKEGYDRYFLKQNFKDHQGNLYDGGFLREIDQPLQLLSGRDDVKDRADLKALTNAAREPNAAKRFDKLDKVLDMDKFISYLALESYTWDWDGYPMNRNNYRIYHDKKAGKLVFIPSGMDQMFGNPGGPVLPGFQGTIANAVIQTPEGKKRYLARMLELQKTVCEPTALIKRLDALQLRVQPALTAIDKGAGRDYPNQVNRLREGIRQRSKSIEQQLKK